MGIRLRKITTMASCLAAAMVLVATSAGPVLAAPQDGENNGKAYGHERQDRKDDGARAGDDSAEQETQPANEQSSQDDGDADGPGKNWDNEGSPRGKSSGQCDNTHGGSPTGGVYDSTCDGSSGKNGNGGGGANGRPCAGCVGNADYKEPPGQLKDGDHDGNAGYECDGNNGIARSNPAHTSCKRPPTTNELCPPGTDLAGMPPGSTGCDLPPNELCPPGTDLAGMPPGTTGCDLPPSELCPPGTDRAGMLPGPDGCDDDVLGRTDKVCPAGTDRAGEVMVGPDDCVLGKVIHNAGDDEPLGAVLPFTGAGDAYLWAAIGLLLIVAGLVTMKLRKQN